MSLEEFKDLLEKLESLGFEAGREAKTSWGGWQKRRDAVVVALIDGFKHASYYGADDTKDTAPISR